MLQLPWQSLCLLFGLFTIGRPVVADDLAAAREQLYAAQAAKLQSLASWCDSNGLTKQTELTRKWLSEQRQRHGLCLHASAGQLAASEIGRIGGRPGMVGSILRDPSRSG